MVYLSDIPTPSFLIDIPTLEKQFAPPTASLSTSAASSGSDHRRKPASFVNIPPPLLLPLSQQKIVPIHLDDTAVDASSAAAASLCSEPFRGQWWDVSGVCFLHSRVIRSRDQYRRQNSVSSSNKDDNDDSHENKNNAFFLAQLDLPDRHSSSTTPSPFPEAQLVLGRNNHHVISYYWARSAGAGAAMEAPGIELVNGNTLQW